MSQNLKKRKCLFGSRGKIAFSLCYSVRVRVGVGVGIGVGLGLGLFWHWRQNSHLGYFASSARQNRHCQKKLNENFW